jgi:hypothetical protein
MSARARTLLLLAVSAACHRTVPLVGAVPEAGMHVVATLAADASTRHAAAVGPGVRVVEGIVRRATTDSVRIDLLATRGADGRTVRWQGQAMDFARADLSRLARRQFDRRRTWLTAGTASLLAVVTGIGFARGSDGVPRDGGIITPPQ